MNTKQVNASDGRVTRATGDIAMNTKNTKQGQSIAEGLSRFLSSIDPSLRSFVASFVDKARDKDGGALFTVYCSLFTGFLLAAFAPRAEAGVAATGGTDGNAGGDATPGFHTCSSLGFGV